MLIDMGLFGKRKQRRLFELERARIARRMANEDVTLLGEELSELHYDTLATELKGEIGDDYANALDAYDRAKQLLRTIEGAEVVKTLLPVLEDGRFYLACVLARQAGRPPPQRLPSCFFNSQHGPSHGEVDWQPPGGDVRRVAVCLTDLNRLEALKQPAIRMVRVGDQLVPWFEADKAFAFVDGKVDMRRFKELRAANHALATQYGADVSSPANQLNRSGGGFL
jgi:hypothetical protein